MLINITIPVFNEQLALPVCVRRLSRFLSNEFKYNYEIVVANNGSTDQTQRVALDLAREFPELRVVHLNQKGRGGALKHVWMSSKADVCSYMDVDLSTDLRCFPALIESVVSGGFDIAVGSRLRSESKVVRGFKREAISRVYNLTVKCFFRSRFSDAQCGFKAINRSAAMCLLPVIEDSGWFLDTELLVIAEKCGYSIFDLPVSWTDDPDSRVRIIKTALEDIRGLFRLRRSFREGRYANVRKSMVAGNLAACRVEPSFPPEVPVGSVK